MKVNEKPAEEFRIVSRISLSSFFLIKLLTKVKTERKLCQKLSKEMFLKIIN